MNSSYCWVQRPCFCSTYQHQHTFHSPTEYWLVHKAPMAMLSRPIYQSRPPYQGNIRNQEFLPLQYYPNNTAQLVGYAAALRQNIQHNPGHVQLPTDVRRQVRFEVIEIGGEDFLDEPLKLSYQNYTPNEHILCQRYHELERTRIRYECNWLAPHQLRYYVWKPMIFERQVRQDGFYSFGMLPAPYKVVPDPEPLPWIEPPPVLATLTAITPATSKAITKDTEPVLRPPQCSINWQNKAQPEPRVNRNLDIPPRFRPVPRNNGFQSNRGPVLQRIPPGFNLAQIYGSSFFNQHPGHQYHQHHQFHAGQRRQPMLRINHFHVNHHHNFIQYRH